MKTKKLFNVKGLKLSLRGMSLRAEGEAISKAKGIALALPRNVTQNLSFDNIKAKALSYSFFLCLLLSIFCVLTSCGKQNQAPVATNASYTSADETGQLALTLQWEGQNNSKFSAPAGVATIRIIITATGMNTVSQDFTASLGGGSITNVLAGTDRTVTAYGLDASGYMKYGGSLSGVNIAAGETTTVAIVLIAQLQSVAPTATITADSTTGNAPLNVTFTVGYTDPENTTGNYSLDFGDGTTAGTGTLASAATTTVSHAYSSSGSYTATLTVTDAHGTVGTGNLTITAGPILIATINVGNSPYGVAVNQTINKIYVANNSSNTVSVIDGASNTVIATVNVGIRPWNIVANKTTNKIYVTNQSSGTISVIDGASNTVIATVNVGISPIGISVNETTNKVYVADNNNGNTVRVIDGTNNTIIATVIVGNSPNNIGVNKTTNKIYVTNWVSNTLSVIDGTNNTVIATVNVGNNPCNALVNETTNKIYVSNCNSNTLSVIDGTNNTVIATVNVENNPSIWDNEITNKIYVANQSSGTLSVIDGTNNTIIATVIVGSKPGAVSVNETTNKIYVANEVSNTVSVIYDPPNL